jgi:hypothetical protein
MAENIKLSLTTSELYGNKNRKVSRVTISSSDTEFPITLSQSDLDKLQERGVTAEIGAFYIGSSARINPTAVNQSSTISSLESIRQAGSLLTTSYGDMTDDAGESNLLERIPYYLDLDENKENLQRMVSEYGDKLDNLEYLRLNLFDPSYAVSMYNVGRGTDITSNLASGKFTSVDGGFTISGYLKVEHASTAISMNVVVRGVPIMMRRTLTSSNSDGTANYIFTYPQYAIDTEDSVNSVQHIEVSGQGSSANLKFFKGSGSDPKYGFLINSTTTNDNDYGNLQIANKENRNEY